MRLSHSGLPQIKATANSPGDSLAEHDFIVKCERELGSGAVFRRSSKSRTVGFLKEVVFVKEHAGVSTSFGR